MNANFIPEAGVFATPQQRTDAAHPCTDAARSLSPPTSLRINSVEVFKIFLLLIPKIPKTCTERSRSIPRSDKKQKHSILITTKLNIK